MQKNIRAGKMVDWNGCFGYVVQKVIGEGCWRWDVENKSWSLCMDGSKAFSLCSVVGQDTEIRVTGAGKQPFQGPMKPWFVRSFRRWATRQSWRPSGLPLETSMRHRVVVKQGKSLQQLDGGRGIERCPRSFGISSPIVRTNVGIFRRGDPITLGKVGRYAWFGSRLQSRT